MAPVNFLDYVLPADGSDRSLAMTRALQSNAWVYVPAGTYSFATLPVVVPANRRITLDQGANYGIACTDTKETLCSINRISNIGGVGIYFAGGSAALIQNNDVRSCNTGGTSSSGIRVNNFDRVTLSGNSYRKDPSKSNHAVYAISLSSTTTAARRYGNMILGQGQTADIDPSEPAGVNKSPLDSGL